MPNLDKEWVDAYYDYGVDTLNRRIFLMGEINDESVSQTIKSIYLLDSYNKKAAIELFVSSSGGDVYGMFALLDCLGSIAAPIHTVAMGQCMSAAPLLVAAGSPGCRFAMPNCMWMLHQGDSEIPGATRLEDLKNYSKHLQYMEETWISLMARYTKKPTIEWKKIVRAVGDTYFDSEKALEYGIVDEIWSEKDGE